MIDGSNNVTFWPSSPPLTKPEEVDQDLFHLALPFANVEDSPADA